MREYFLRHLISADAAVHAEESPPGQRPRAVTWRERAPVGKLDLLLSLDFRMTSTTVFSDVALPAPTWYKKHDLPSTDMHPFVHAGPAPNGRGRPRPAGCGAGDVRGGRSLGIADGGQ